MGRASAGLLASGAVLFLSGALGLVEAWALVAGVLSLAAGGVAFAIATEARDLRDLHVVSSEVIAPNLDPAA